MPWCAKVWYACLAEAITDPDLREIVGEALRGTEDIATAIRSAMAGGSPINPRIARRVLEMFSKANVPHKDYGLTPLEAAAFGVPTLALEAGGYLDTVAPGVSGLFFPEPTPAAVAEAVEAGERHTWSAEAIRAHAALFSAEVFVAALRAHVDALRST